MMTPLKDWSVRVTAMKDVDPGGLASWWENPLVKIARQSVPEESGAAGVLRHLDGLLRTLDEIAPGVPYMELLSASAVDQNGRAMGTLRARVLMGRYMLSQGMPLDEVEQLLCRNGRVEQRERKRTGDVVEDIHTQVQSFNWLSTRYDDVQRRASVLKMHADGLRNVDIAKKLGCCKETVSRILRRAS